jgi:DNA-binding MarR family transcriptional regulator
MSQPEFNEIIHAPHRLRICAMLAAVDTMEFGVIRDELGVADSVLSKHLKVLTEAGYVRLQKPLGLGGKARTWVRITSEGRRALTAHLAELHRLTEMAQAPTRP